MEHHLARGLVDVQYLDGRLGLLAARAEVGVFVGVQLLGRGKLPQTLNQRRLARVVQIRIFVADLVPHRSSYNFGQFRLLLPEQLKSEAVLLVDVCSEVLNARVKVQGQHAVAAAFLAEAALLFRLFARGLHAAQVEG